ncbi:11374_t:CDS:2, partial [Funneliformis mosseae]
MTRKGNSGSNRDCNKSRSGSRIVNRNRARGANSSHRGRGGRDRDNNNDRRRDDVQRPPPTHLNVPEIKQIFVLPNYHIMVEGYCKFPSMSCDAGLNPRIYSFQHVILPLLGLLTRTAITKCILEKYVHAIYMVVYNSLVNIVNGSGRMCNVNSFADNQVSAEELLRRERYAFIPSS